MQYFLFLIVYPYMDNMGVYKAPSDCVINDYFYI